MNSANMENFRKLISNEKSGWLEKAKQRKDNKVWTNRSTQIAVRILRAIREQKTVNGMTQAKLAEEMGVSAQYINKIVKGQENLTLKTIANIEKCLGIVLIEVPAFTSLNLPLEISPLSDSIKRNTAVPMGAKVIELDCVYTQHTGTNG
ncbi:MAG: helix-turn-helix domain-containing protein [Bacteroidales bacterium]|jgi:transcriptional regulator with XRE-family HTH domain